uniref:Uncharacterized protein n=1 Tax=Aegilops tauschii subsp. strangulata TaxID=200361 RepID=A0A453PMR5_AEGTS
RHLSLPPIHIRPSRLFPSSHPICNFAPHRPLTTFFYPLMSDPAAPSLPAHLH